MTVVTTLLARYILLDKLNAFLRANFDDETYRIDISDEYVEVTAPRTLTQAEISSVTWRQ